MPKKIPKKSNSIPHVDWENGTAEFTFAQWLLILDAVGIWTKMAVMDLQEFTRETEAMLDAA